MNAPASGTPLITPATVGLGLTATNKADATRQLIHLLAQAGRVTDENGFAADVAAREAQMPTGMPGGVGLPHARSQFVTAPSLAVGTFPGGVDFGDEEGPATLVFCIAAPAGGDNAHLQILAALARKLIHSDFRDTIKNSSDPAAVAQFINEQVQV